MASVRSTFQLASEMEKDLSNVAWAMVHAKFMVEGVDDETHEQYGEAQQHLRKVFEIVNAICNKHRPARVCIHGTSWEECETCTDCASREMSI